MSIQTCMNSFFKHWGKKKKIKHWDFKFYIFCLSKKKPSEPGLKQHENE